jgi:hypothetical protein
VNRDPRIDAYVANAQPFAQPILSHIRERVHVVLPAVEETVKWSMPTYTLGGKIVLITAAFKAHTALNFWRGQELKSSHDSVGAMGQFGRIASIDELPANDELDRLILEAAELAMTAPTPRKAKHPPKPVPELHPQFLEALGKAAKAKETFDAFRPVAGANISNGSARPSTTPPVRSVSPPQSSG